MKNLLIRTPLLMGLLFSLGSFLLSNQVIASEVSVEHGYVRATIPGTKVSSAYMEIVNEGEKPVVLLSASGQISDRIEIHQHTMENGMMRMRQQDSLTIPAHDSVTLQPGGYHLMIFNVTQPLKVNDEITLTLHFKEAAAMTVTLPVKSIVRKKQTENHHHHH
ncbi:copper chaperone PCu(A)C [Thalassotalea sp. G2M2-11]|uniref:copper chaperone PCu(A)C n=1 Tax=Thalassotalea sp. G2M2-11 TaxID=2787627 RepID=UPI001F49A800|nr:copper chaperone PCu(A)C [Thalassotalea sp. G2M2-11]